MNLIIRLFQKIVFILSYLNKNNLNEKSVLKNFKIQPGIVFDVGSNTGSYIDLLIKTYSSKIEIHSFEPQQNLCGLQKRRYRGLDIVINNFGLGAENGYSDFYISSASSQSSYEKRNNQLIGEIKTVEKKKTKRLDSYCEEKKIDYIDILKIDTEGWEYAILSSAKELLEHKKIGLIKVEITNYKDNFSKIFSLIEKKGYKFLGFCNQKYANEKLLFVDAYFSAE
tara:strand:- start:239 stop:913 length:675 start_codon:yes stop_codon:yes gene_type:complete